jgi:hypothetical protein
MKKLTTNSISSSKFDIRWRGICFAAAGYVAFEMLSERRTGTVQSDGVETGID